MSADVFAQEDGATPLTPEEQQLVKIHPWPNGNGRHSRLMADVLVAARGGEALTWGAGADLAPEGGIRKRYREAVRAADQQEFGPLLNFARS